MELATKILIVGGMFGLAVGTVTGFFFILERSRAEFAPRYLVMTHVGMFMQGAMLLGLAFAVNLSSLSAGVENVAAILLVASAVLALRKSQPSADRLALPHSLYLFRACSFSSLALSEGCEPGAERGKRRPPRRRPNSA
jgi:hypothetical protein